MKDKSFIYPAYFWSWFVGVPLMRFSHLAALLRMQISGYFHHGLCSAGEITYLHSKEARFFKVVFCASIECCWPRTFWCGHYPLPSSHFLKGFLAVDPWKFLIVSLNREITSIIFGRRRWTPLLFYFLLDRFSTTPNSTMFTWRYSKTLKTTQHLFS